jgi:hypothetical protein
MLASDIALEFAEHRPHYENVTCQYLGGVLMLSAESDFDPDGLNLMDEFSDCMCAYGSGDFDGEMHVISRGGAAS